MQLELGKRLLAHIDDSDAELVEPFNWTPMKGSTGTYALGRMAMPPGFFTVQLHRLIVNAAPGQFVEFRDGDSLNCRRSNLRIAESRGEIRRRHKPRPNQSSPYRGVCLDKANGYFRAALMHRGERFFLGFFETDLEAAKSYNQKSRELLGDRAFQNEIP